MIHLSCKNRNFNEVISLTRSKSESNRGLILKALFEGELEILHLSDSDDSKVLTDAIRNYKAEDQINVGHAGTSFRFLTAFLAIQEKGGWLLTGSDRMKERPVAPLVEALNLLGAKINYTEKKGYPPLKITGGAKLKNEVSIHAGISSQYISALMMVGAKMSDGLIIRLKGEITSQPYIEMTASMMLEVGIDISIDFDQQIIEVKKCNQLSSKVIEIEADWSAASYWFSAVALAEQGTIIALHGLNDNSRQGDVKVVDYYKELGVSSEFLDGVWRLEKTKASEISVLSLDLSDTPDVAQTLVCTCAGLGVGVNFTGLHTLRIKETDRLEALKIELSKFGTVITISEDQLRMDSGQLLQTPSSSIATYKDHRMAMAFAPLALLADLKIENEEVVSKSYPNFWEDLKKIVNVES